MLSTAKEPQSRLVRDFVSIAVMLESAWEGSLEEEEEEEEWERVGSTPGRGSRPLLTAPRAGTASGLPDPLSTHRRPATVSPATGATSPRRQPQDKPRPTRAPDVRRPAEPSPASRLRQRESRGVKPDRTQCANQTSSRNFVSTAHTLFSKYEISLRCSC